MVPTTEVILLESGCFCLASPKSAARQKKQQNDSVKFCIKKITIESIFMFHEKQYFFRAKFH